MTPAGAVSGWIANSYPVVNGSRNWYAAGVTAPDASAAFEKLRDRRVHEAQRERIELVPRDMEPKLIRSDLRIVGYARAPWWEPLVVFIK